VPISLSFGIACYPNDGQSRHELLTIADSNLYQAKNSDEGIVFTSESQRANRELRAEASFEVLDALITAVDNKDRYTRKHSEDVTEYALWMAEELGLSEETMRTLRIGGLLHDVGKIGVPDEILRKPGRLTDEEFEIMKRHPRLGEMIVGGIPGMSSILDAVRSHHERWDGMGYPDRLKGEEIPFMGRLLAVADAFSAMTTDRPYRKGLNLDKALAEIRANIGTQFDPEMADAFLRAVEKRKPVLTHAEQELPKAA
jgi:putative nucleotidyltransferase with HDIG domain